MQGVTVDPRNNLSSDDVLGILLNDSSVQIQQGAYWLDSSFSQIGDLTQYMQPGCSVSFDNTAQIQATCSLSFQSDCPMNILTDFVQPYMVMTNDRGVSAEFRLGVYTLQSPPYDLETSLGVQTFSGYDLNYLLTVPMNDSFSVGYGQNIIAQVIELLALAIPGVQVNYTDNPSTATNNNFSWPLGGDGGGEAATYMDAINQMLNSIGYENVWFDWEGNAQLTPHEAASTRMNEFTFDLEAANNNVAVQRTVEQDIFDVPNQWVFILNDLETPPQEGISQYTFVDADASHPGSVVNRRRVYTSMNFVTAADYGSMVALAKKQIASDLQPAETYSFSTFPFPLAWWSDIITIQDPNLAQVPPTYQTSRKMNVITWTLPLDGSNDMAWTANTVTI